MLLALLAASAVQLTAPGPQGPLAGTLLDAGRGTPVVLVIPGSGPTDRDGNNPLGVTAAPLRLLAEALAEKGISTVRIDKRGMFGSKAAVADANAVTIADYASDVRAWVDTLKRDRGVPCVWVLGHSEGALVTLLAAQKPEGICGVILAAGSGKRFGDLIRDQLKANPANAPVLDSAMAAIDSLEQGKRVDVSTMHPGLQRLFAPEVQGYLIDVSRQDPARLAAAVTGPILIVHGERDMQVTPDHAKLLAAAQPKAQVTIVPRMTHILKDVASDDRAANLATLTDASRPVSAGLVDAIAGFVRR